MNSLMTGGEGESSDATNDRTKLASRGGLLYMKATTYLVFHAVELVVCQSFRKNDIRQVTSGAVNDVDESIMQNEDVAFYWCMAGVNNYMDFTTWHNQTLHG